MKKILSLLALTALTIGLLGSCKKEEPKVSVTGISLDKTELTLTIGDPDVKLVATVTPDNATDKTVNWASDKAEVATVDNQGSVHAVAPGEAIITVTTTDGGKTATCAVTVKADLPDDALKGEFSVSATKKVHFSQGNLYYDGSVFKFEANQYSGTSYANNHVSHFYWSKSVDEAVKEEYNWEQDCDENDVFFTNETETTSKDGFTVNVGGTEQTGWRTLSTAEWQYLFNTRTDAASKVGFATVGGVHGIIILPDSFTDPMKNNGNGAFVPKSSNGWTQNVYTSGDNWNAMETAGAVFLPAAGDRFGSRVDYVGDWGFYWSSSSSGSEGGACAVEFSSYLVDHFSGPRNRGYSVRLITESK